MKCKTCGNSIPDDSDYCPFCGNSQPTPLVKNVESDEPLPVTGKSVQTKKGGRSLVPVLVLAIAVLVLGGLNVFQYLTNKEAVREKTSTIIEQDTILSDREATLSEQEGVIKDLNATIAKLERKVTGLEENVKTWENKADLYQDKAGYFDYIQDQTSAGRYGYASSNFHTSTGVVTLSQGQTKSITLTAYWTYGGTVEITRFNSGLLADHASISFDSHNWSTYTGLTITGNSKGVTVATFSNTADSDTFKLLIIVT